jgi:hypothetical protein
MTWIGLPAFQNTAICEMLGTTSLSSSSRFPSSPYDSEDTPVAFPPGRASFHRFADSA